MREEEEVHEEEDKVKLPVKIANQGRIPTANNNVPVQLNAFRMNISHAVPEEYQFEIHFFAILIVQPRGQQETPQVKELDLAKGPENDESKETRRRLLWQLFQQLLDRYPDFFGHNKCIFTYDCAEMLYCTRDLGLTVGSPAREFRLIHNPATLEERCRAYSRRIDQIRVAIHRTDTVDIRNGLAAYIQGDQSAVQFLEVLSSQQIFAQNNHYFFGNQMYGNIPLPLSVDPYVLMEGMEKSVRFVGDNLQNAGPILQLDPKKSVFYPAVELLEFVCEFVQMNENDLQHNWQRYFDQINKQIKGVF